MVVNKLSKEELIKWINKEFRIKINGRNYIGKSLSEIVGFSGLVEILGNEGLAIRICRRALNCKEDIFIQKLRRGLTIKFYTK